MLPTKARLLITDNEVFTFTPKSACKLIPELPVSDKDWGQATLIPPIGAKIDKLLPVAFGATIAEVLTKL